MSDKFQVGELVITQKADFWKEFDGHPAVVTGPCLQHHATDMRTMEKRFSNTYSVCILTDPPRYVCSRSEQLRKLLDTPPSVEREKVRHKPIEALVGEGDEK